MKIWSNYIFAPLLSSLASAVHTDSQTGTYSWDYQSKSESSLAPGSKDRASTEISDCLYAISCHKADFLYPEACSVFFVYILDLVSAVSTSQVFCPFFTL